MHPLHPILAHLPAGLWLASFAMEAAFLGSLRDPRLARAAYDCIGAGLVAALIAAPAGIAELRQLRRRPRLKPLVHAYGAAQATVFALFTAGFLLRGMPGAEPPTEVGALPFLLSGLALGIFAGSSWLGGKLLRRWETARRARLRGEPRSAPGIPLGQEAPARRSA